MAEAQERERPAKSELETLKLRNRGAELVADAVLRYVGPDLVIKWREACLERRRCSRPRMVLSKFGLGVTADMQWRVFRDINSRMREMPTAISSGRSDVSEPLAGAESGRAFCTGVVEVVILVDFGTAKGPQWQGSGCGGRI